MIERIAAGLTMLALLGAAGPAAAQELEPEQERHGAHPPYIGMLVGYAKPDEEFAPKGRGVNAALYFGKPVGKHLGFEINLNGSVFETGAPDETDFYQTALQLSAAWNFREHRGEQFSPFVMLGIGVARNDVFPDSGDSTDMLLGAGFGFVTGPLNHMGMRIRGEARYIHDTFGDGHGEPRVSIGLELPLRHAHPEQAHPVRIVERTVERVVEVPRQWVDTDGDGVDDDHDRCPDTASGLRADATGCLIENQTLELAGVTFEFAQARLTSNAETILDRVATSLVGQTTGRFEIAGHTDTVGDKRANQFLSEKRAAAVRAYLVAKGVSPDVLVSKGYGESQLLVDPELTPDDAERNRRVELRVLSAETPKEMKP